MFIGNAQAAGESTMTPKVSVIIPTYNRASFITKAIQSVINQTCNKFELIVVDDGSTDNTPQLAASITDPRFKYIQQNNQGRSIARNNGANQAEGEYLCFLDSDDRYTPYAIEAHLAEFNKRPDLGMTIGAYHYINENDHFLASREPWLTGGDLSLQRWLFDCFAIPGSIMIKKEWFMSIGGFDKSCEIAEDWALFLQLANRGCPMGWTYQPVCLYRVHSQNSINTLDQHYQGSICALEKLFQTTKNPNIIQLHDQSMGWLNVVFAKRALVTERPEVSLNYLEEAINYDRSLAGKRKINTIEHLLASNGASIDASKSTINSSLEQLFASLHASRREIRRARARVELARLYQAIDDPEYENAFDDLVKILILDPTWLLNRGILSMLLKSIVHK